MNCPKDGTALREREKGDVIIDICPNCHGVWLDAGELEKLSEREQRYYDDDRRRRRDDGDDFDDDDDDDGGLFGGGQGRGGRRQGFLANVFDAFGGGGD
jgi:Zn-finger nucleic acid-binding protein